MKFLTLFVALLVVLDTRAETSELTQEHDPERNLPALSDAEIGSLSYDAWESMVLKKLGKQETFNELSKADQEAYLLGYVIRSAKSDKNVEPVLENAKDKFVATKTKAQLFDLIVKISAIMARQQYYSAAYTYAWGQPGRFGNKLYLRMLEDAQKAWWYNPGPDDGVHSQ